MPKSGRYLRTRVTRQSPDEAHPVSSALRLGQILLITICAHFAPSLFAQTSDSTITDQRNTSWTATTDLKSGDLLPTRIPVRIIESHRQIGNQTFEERSVQIQGVDGHLAPFQDIETESMQVDGTTVRTTVRTFGRDVNGGKSLIQVTKEEKHSLPDGDSTVLRTTFNADANGNLQPVQHDMVEIKMISKDVEETNTTVMLPNINGGLAPVFRTTELQKQHGDGTTEAQKTTLLADGAGKWELSETRQVTTSLEGANRTAEERVFRSDAEGKLAEVSRVVTKESANGSGEKKQTLETYSVDLPGGPRDRSLHLVERATTAQRTGATGEQVTEKKVEQLNPGNPSSGLRLSVLVNDKMVPGPSGEHSTVTIRARDSNGSFGIVSVSTTRSDRIPTIQIQ